MLPLHELIINRFREEFGEEILASEVRTRTEGVTKPMERKSVWVTLHRRIFHRAATCLSKFGALHICTPMASKEFDDHMEIIYPFTIYGGTGNYMELPVVFTVMVPLNDLRIRTLTDIVPGILNMERETQEMLGVLIEDIPDSRRIFTPHNLSDDMKPMRDSSLSGNMKAGGTTDERS